MVLSFWHWYGLRERVALNDWRKMASQGADAVPDFIPPGAEAEIVIIDKTHPAHSTADRFGHYDCYGCAGCRYAGRYVLKGKGL